ncbi:MAG: hypothetical protein ACLFV4_09235 [Candidatus Hydrogenedentota bacterium]
MFGGDSSLIETVFAAAAGILAFAWPVVKSTEWYARHREQRREQAVATLEAAVEETYRRYVQVMKAANGGEPLTEEQRDNARRLARERAEELGREQGLDVVRELGASYLDLWITRLVKRLKARF